MNYISKNKQSFGAVAKDYKKYRGEYNTALYKALFDLIKVKKGQTVSILDLGCGVGNSTEPVFEMARKMGIEISIVGCDPDSHMLKEARLSAKKNKYNITYVQGSAEKLPFESGQFDVIISGAAFHWFATKKALTEIKRVMSPGGMYFAFWAQNVKSDKPAIGHELFKEYGFKGIPTDLRDPKYVKSIFIKNGFSKTTISKVPSREVKSITESIGLIKTNSGYAILSSGDKKDFLRKMTAEYKKALGSKMNVLRQDIHFCFGYKK